MKYELVSARRAVRDIEKHNDQVKRRIKKALETYRDDPCRYLEKLSNPELGSFQFRMGDYRVVFDLDGQKIVVLRVGHRRAIYRGI